MSNIAIKTTGSKYILQGATSFMNQIVPITELKRNLSDVLEKLKNQHTLYIMKNTSVMAVMIEKETIEEISHTLEYQSNYIVQLENEIAILESFKDPERFSHESILDKLNKAKESTQ